VTRVAAVDIGTNSTRLLVADVGEGGVEPIVRRSTVTSLGRGVDASRRLSPDAIERVHRVLARYYDELEALGAVSTLAVGTSAVRDAADGAEFLAGVEERFGFETRLLSGDEEAELTRRGVGAGSERTLVLDVGGGSTELIAGSFHVSIDVGSVRLTERHLHSDPPTPA
jgi:exopolyphosphatase/guanosine-5'-triphosphate,3'-diphosphate pyrophosphatase